MSVKQIPQPKTYGPLGNLPLMDKEKPIQQLMNIASEFEGIFKFELPKRTVHFVSSHRLVKEICNESYFDKNINQALQNVRNFSGDGLFTSWSHEANWKKAHNILLPSFSQQAMKGYHAKMVDIAVQLIQKIPALIDEQLANKGAECLIERGEADASHDFDGAYEEWRDQLWIDLADYFELHVETNETDTPSLSLTFVDGTADTPLAKTHQAFTTTVLTNDELQQPCSQRSTRHIEIALPQGITYKEGDHLGVIPKNHKQLVERALTHFHLNGSKIIQLKAETETLSHLPINQTVSLYDLCANFVELQQPVTRTQLRALIAKTVCPPHKFELETLLEKDNYKEKVLSARLTMLDLLEKYPACEMEFIEFIELLPGLKPRYYSISSSPKANDDVLSITVSVVQSEAWSGNGEYKGIASNYLAELKENDPITCFISSPQSGFELPKDPQTPIIMVGPGTGIAPFRGFIQARGTMKKSGIQLGKAHLYFGCRSAEEDYLYQSELEQANEQGVITLHTAFSRMNSQQKTYVQHLMAENGKELIALLDKGAYLYICGDGSKMAPDVENTLIDCYQSVHSVNENQARNWLQALESAGRYAKDVWTG
ncbi:cytochrome P450 [Priestia megaterium]|nr:cytochrome P450 [Priestia megaterium]